MEAMMSILVEVYAFAAQREGDSDHVHTASTLLPSGSIRNAA
jgi:hypothetical protein